MSLERFRLKSRGELEFIFNKLKEREDSFLANGLVYENLFSSQPSVIPLFLCSKCVKKPLLSREESPSKKMMNNEHKNYRWRYTCPECGGMPVHNSKSIFLAKLEWNFNHIVMCNSADIPVFNLKFMPLEERKKHLHYIREVLECRVNKMEVEYFLSYSQETESVRKRFLDDIERYKLFLHWQQLAQRIVAHEIKQISITNT